MREGADENCLSDLNYKDRFASCSGIGTGICVTVMSDDGSPNQLKSTNRSPSMLDFNQYKYAIDQKWLPA